METSVVTLVARFVSIAVLRTIAGGGRQTPAAARSGANTTPCAIRRHAAVARGSIL
jgi:hypothetical protein